MFLCPYLEDPGSASQSASRGREEGLIPDISIPFFPRTIYGHKSRDPVSWPEHDLRSTTTPRLCWRGLSSITPLRSSLLLTRTPRRPRMHPPLPRSALSPTRRSHVRLCTRQRPTGSFHHSVKYFDALRHHVRGPTPLRTMNGIASTPVRTAAMQGCPSIPAYREQKSEKQTSTHRRCWHARLRTRKHV